MEFKLRYLKREIPDTVPVKKDATKKFYNYDLLKKAYAKWTAANPSCCCSYHGNALRENYSPACTRDRAWVAYVKTREGIKLSADELFLVGAL